jgi:hypothetical protein
LCPEVRSPHRPLTLTFLPPSIVHFHHLFSEQVPLPSVLSPKVEAALKFCATSKAGVEVIRDDLERQLDALYAEGPLLEDDKDDDHDIDGVVEPHEFLKDWKEGIDGYERMSQKAILKHLGIPDGAWPFFNNLYDSVGLRNPKSDPEAFEAGVTLEIKPLRLRWDQLVGVARAIDNAFKGHPLALCDEVGFGKTIQLAATIAALRWFRDFRTRHGTFPGDFGKLSVPGRESIELKPVASLSLSQAGKDWPNSPDGNIIDALSVVVVPTPLHDQYLEQFRRFFKPDSFDVFPYVGSANVGQRLTWWTAVENRSHQRDKCAKIILASQSVSKLTLCFSPSLTNPFPLSLPQAIEADVGLTWTVRQSGFKLVTFRKPGVERDTERGENIILYSRLQNILVCAFDEMHEGRRLNRPHYAVSRLNAKAQFCIGMSATPMQQSPMVCR